MRTEAPPLEPSSRFKSNPYIEKDAPALYAKSGKSVPAWVTENQLIRFRGVDLIPVQGRS